MTTSGRCDNPMCSCDPCTCDDCACGGANLGVLERRVMGILWARAVEETDAGEITGREVADQLPGHAYTTVATVLDRLVRKGLVLRRMDGRRIRFAPVGSPDAHAAVLMRQAMAEGPDPEATLVTFAQSLSPTEVATLRDALRDVGLEPADSAP